MSQLEAKTDYIWSFSPILYFQGHITANEIAAFLSGLKPMTH